MRHPETRPSFETPRLLIRPRTLAETDDCLAMDRQPEVTRHVRGPWTDAAAHQAFIEERTSRPTRPGLGYWSIRMRQDPGLFAGWLLLAPVDGADADIEIGWRLRREAWGHGFAAEAARPLLGHAFATLGLAEVIADIEVANERSRRLAERLGFRPQSPPRDAATLRYALTQAQAASLGYLRVGQANAGTQPKEGR